MGIEDFEFDLEQTQSAAPQVPRLGPILLTPENKRKLLVGAGIAIIAALVIVIGAVLVLQISTSGSSKEGDGQKDPALIDILSRLSSSEKAIRTHLQYLASDLLQVCPFLLFPFHV